MRALVTGGRGFIGSTLIEHLIAQGFDVTCLLRHSRKGLGWLDGVHFDHIEGDLSNRTALKQAVTGVDYVFHLAALTKAYKQEEFIRVNVEGTKSLLQAIGENNPKLKKFILVSSLAAAGPSISGQSLSEEDKSFPISNYGRSKLEAEKATLSYDSEFPVCVVRPPAVYGPRDKDMFTIFKMTKQGWLPRLGGRMRVASLIHVDDLVSGIRLAACNPVSNGQLYYLSNEDDYAWEEVESLVAELMGTFPKKIQIPIAFAFLFCLSSGLISRVTKRPALFNLDKYRELKETHWICNSATARQELGFQTRYSLKEGFMQTLEWYREHGWI
ncbi:MAG: NAD-dependent epimerase/dehydratase family protein [bacterium]